MLVMVERGIRGGICHAIHRYIKTNNKYMEIEKIKKIKASLHDRKNMLYTHNNFIHINTIYTHIYYIHIKSMSLVKTKDGY